MSTFKEVFNRASIYDMLFFNVKSVLEYPTIEKLKTENLPLFKQWQEISKYKYNCDYDVVDATEFEKNYLNKAPFYPEYSMIVAITYASIYMENGELKRAFKRIVDTDEVVVLETFIDVLNQISSESAQSTPQIFPILCGHNILNNDIPLLIKRFIKLLPKFKTSIKQLPYILKRSLDIKPWESGVLDTSSVWKFNGFENASLMLISEFLELKKNIDVLSPSELSKYYWDNIYDDIDGTLKYVALQSATQTNLVIQIINGLRQL